MAAIQIRNEVLVIVISAIVRFVNFARYSHAFKFLFCVWFFYPFFFFDYDRVSEDLDVLDFSLTAKEDQPCALLFFGLMKSFEHVALPSIKERLLPNNQHCDIFLHTYALEETPKNARNSETITEKVNLNKVYLLTENVAFESMEVFEEKRKDFLTHSRENHHKVSYGKCCTSHDNMIKQWNSIEGVWNLMRKKEIEKVGNKNDNYYKYVGLFRTDTYIVTEIPSISSSNAAAPIFGSFGGVNDRLFYGSYKNAKIWSHRFDFSKTFEEQYMKPFDPERPKKGQTGYHSEFYLGNMLEHHRVKLKRKNLCVWRIRNEGGLTASDCKGHGTLIETLPEGYISSVGVQAKNSRIYHFWAVFWDMLSRPSKWDESMPPLKLDSDQVGVVVLSMHKSGSSMLSGFLTGGFGFHAGGDENALIIDNSDNLKTLARQNDAFLYGQGLDWKSRIDQYNEKKTLEELKEGRLPIVAGTMALQALTQKSGFDKSIPWIMKDPMLCITLKVWLTMLAKPPAIVFVYRNPLEVARSLNEDDEEDEDSIDKFLLLWILYNKAAIQNSENLCRVIVEKSKFDKNLVKESERIVKALRNNCGVHKPPEKLKKDFAIEFFDEAMVIENVKANGDVVETYNGCKIREYEIQDSSEGDNDNEIYMHAMRVFCDLQSGRAFEQDYAWPNIEKDVIASILGEQKLGPSAMTAIRKHYIDDVKRQKHSEKMKDTCKKVSPHPFKKSLARFIVFQRDTGHKLHHLISHYTNVVPYDDIVVIDHKGNDTFTSKALDDYIEKGMHVWRCEGEFYQKDTMWSYVIRQYAAVSKFVFPLDSDEYMTILGKDELHWSYESFRKELMSLPNIDKPFKTIRSNPIPLDCPYTQDESEEIETYSKAPLCRLKYTESDIGHYCYNKCFHRGTYFRSVDKGNHHPNATIGSACKTTYKQGSSREGTDTIPADNELYHLTNFTLLHMQSLEFSDFVLHILRGATSAGFNKATKCSKTIRSHHYCYGLADFRNVDFDTHKMKELYEKKRCQYDKKDPTAALLPLSNIMRGTCREKMDIPYPEWNVKAFEKINLD